MPQVRPVVLNYDETSSSAAWGPTPRQVGVSPDDTIRFRIGDGTRAGIPGCKLRITIHQPENFSKAVLQHSKAQHGSEPLDVEVMPGVAAFAYQPGYVIATYKCELLDSSGNTIPGMASDGASGGEVVPDVAA